MLDYWATEFAQPAVLSRLHLNSTLSRLPASDSDALELSFVKSIPMRLCSLSASAFFLSFARFRSCCRKRTRLLVVAVIELTLVLVVVVVVVVNVIFLAENSFS